MMGTPSSSWAANLARPKAKEPTQRVHLHRPNYENIQLLPTSGSPGTSPEDTPRSTSSRMHVNGRLPLPRKYRHVPTWGCVANVFAAIAVVTFFLGLAYLVLDVRIEMGFHRPTLCVRDDINGSAPVVLGSLSNQSSGDDGDDGKWRGYVHYLQRLELLKPESQHDSSRLKVASRGPYGYIHFSAYRMQGNAIASVGLGARVMKESLQKSLTRCWWEGAEGGRVEGEAQVLYSEEHGDLTYDTVVIQCLLISSTNTSGGTALATIDAEEIVLYKEPPGHEYVIEPPRDEELSHYASVCTPCVKEEVEVRPMVEWVEYHAAQGVTHVTLYDAGALTQVVAEYLDPYLKSGRVDVVPFREIPKYEVLGGGHILSLHDCLYRNRVKAKWVLVLNWDEYMFVPPPSTLLNVLAKYEGRPWLTHGTLVWSTAMCRAGPPLFGSNRWSPMSKKSTMTVERMVYHWPKILCHDAEDPDPRFCTNANGGRKMIYNPREIHTTHFHEVGVPREGGEHLSFEEIRHHLFDKLYLRTVFNVSCSHLQVESSSVEWWIRDLAQVNYIRSLRDQPPVAP